MFHESLRGLCEIRRNDNVPGRFTGAALPWVCVTPDGAVYCDTRESARGVARDYRAERRRLLAEYRRAQGRAEFYD